MRRLLFNSDARDAVAADLYPIMQGFFKSERTIPASAFKGADGVNGAEGLNKSPDPDPTFESSETKMPDPVPVLAGKHLFESGASLVAKAAPVANTFILFPVFIVSNFKLLLQSYPTRGVSFSGITHDSIALADSIAALLCSSSCAVSACCRWWTVLDCVRKMSQMWPVTF